MYLKPRAIALFGVLLCCGSAEANISGSGTNVSSSTSIPAPYGGSNPICSETNPTSSSLRCTVDQTSFYGYVNASLSGISGVGDLGFLSPLDQNYGIFITASLSETLTINGGGPPGSYGYIAVPLSIVLGLGDGDTTTVAVGNQSFSDQNHRPIYVEYGGYLISQFQYGAPFGFSLQAESGGVEGGNSIGEAGFSVSLYGAPIILSSIPSGYTLGFNYSGYNSFNRNGPLGDYLRPAGPNGAADVISAIPEPNTITLAAVLFFLMPVSARLRRRRRNLFI